MPGSITSAMITTIQTRLEDAGGNLHLAAELYGLMTDAQLELAALLDNGYLTEFEEINEDQDVSGGFVELSALNSSLGVLKGKNGIDRVRFSLDSGTTWYEADPIDMADLKEMEGTYFSASNTRPKWYVYKNRLYVKVATLTGAIAEVWCLKPPTDISAAVDPIINKALYPVFLKMIESRAWLIEEKTDRAATVKAEWVSDINALNARIEGKPINTKGK
jgi:hypothetical protein